MCLCVDLHAFLLTHKAYVSSELLLEKLIYRYRNCERRDGSSRKHVLIQLRIVSFLQTWLDEYFYGIYRSERNDSVDSVFF